MSQLFRRGDVVSVRCVVALDQSVDHERVFVRTASDENGTLLFASAADVELIHHGFNPGDRVTYAFDHLGYTIERQGVIEAICDGLAWVKRGPLPSLDDGGGFSTIALADLNPEEGHDEQVQA